MTEPTDIKDDGRHRGRIAFLAVAATLIAIAAGACALEDGAGPQTAVDAGPTASAPRDVATSGPRSPGPDELTTGPLMASSPPLKVSIPALKVTTSVIDLGLQPDGTMEVPDGADTIGWFTGAPTPGSLGPAVLAGHVNWKQKPGVFAHLDRLKPGDAVNVARRDGTMAMFQVTKVDRYPKDRFPSEAVYGPIDHAGLRLITCGGEFDAAARSYRDNVVVYAVLKQAHAM